MPIKVQNDLPAKKVLEDENIFVMDEDRATSQDIRPLRIAILNLMPLKEATEVDILRSLSNTPLQLNITFLTTASYVGKNTAKSHLDDFYLTYEDVKDKKFDGLIITGAPVEQLEFKDVAYWDELCRIFEWSKTNVTSTLHLCWGAQAGLYYHYGISKVNYTRKLFGIYKHRVYNKKTPLLRGFDDVFRMPQSRYTGISREEIVNCKDLTILADSPSTGPSIIMAEEGRRIFVMGHLEYERLTLDNEYRRDLAKGLDTAMPKDYYPDDDPDNKPVLSWRAHGNALYSNWVNYYVYQLTPYEF
ncbi:MAG: homoserine O-succinyltransferase [Lachnospiraceae bacterium]|nr:homoserine O-succinyltransferase [Lachnospiraceae bacterium]